MAIWIKNGKMVDPVRKVIEKRDILIQGGTIVGLPLWGEYQPEDSEFELIDATNKLVLPGLIDMHVHLREPGQEHKETIETGTKAAVTGGFTAVACMPNTIPPNDSPWITESIIEKAKTKGACRVLPIAAITRGQKGKQLTDFAALRKAGAVAVSDDGYPVVDDVLMRKALIHASNTGLVVISHCEDLTLSVGGVMHEGDVSRKIGLKGIPAASEENMVQREITLAKKTGCPVHIAHVSTAGSVELIRQAKEAGLAVTAETAPHYFTLDHRAVIGYDTRMKMNPPLRTSEDVEAIKQGLAHGVIDVIATDHAPHSALEKDLPFEKAPFGIIGLETALPLTLNLVRDHTLGLAEAVGKLSCNAARILHIPGGSVGIGKPADLALVDPDMEYVLLEGDLRSKSVNSPFIGKTLKGRNEMTMIGGEIVWQREA